jgi:hypothetical protein
MPQDLVHFVLLQFSPLSREETVNILLVDKEDGSPLQISIDPGWENRVDPTEREYLVALIDDWRNAPAERISDLTNELCRQSRGPLRLIQSSNATFAHATSLLKSCSREHIQ